MSNKKTQYKKILDHLLSGKTINPLQALNKYKCMRLAARINEMRDDGINIESQMVYTQSSKYKEYWI